MVLRGMDCCAGCCVVGCGSGAGSTGNVSVTKSSFKLLVAVLGSARSWVVSGGVVWLASLCAGDAELLLCGGGKLSFVSRVSFVSLGLSSGFGSGFSLVWVSVFVFGLGWSG